MPNRISVNREEEVQNHLKRSGVPYLLDELLLDTVLRDLRAFINEEGPLYIESDWAKQSF